jgi:hypothetical protein
MKHHPATASSLALKLGLDKKRGIRNAIDALRSKESASGTIHRMPPFWWRNDITPSDVSHTRWKRVVEPQPKVGPGRHCKKVALTLYQKARRHVDHAHQRIEPKALMTNAFVQQSQVSCLVPVR